jgi:1-acyl-sn-glycerol-3-phosphate acyltransferase
LTNLKRRLGDDDEGWTYYERDPLARRIHHLLADRLLHPGSALVGIEHAAAVDGKPVVVFANHLSYADANLIEILLHRSGGGALADRLNGARGSEGIQQPTPAVFQPVLRRDPDAPELRPVEWGGGDERA